MTTANKPKIEFKHKYYLRAGRHMSYLFENDEGKIKMIVGANEYYDGRRVEDFMMNMGPLAVSGSYVPEGFMLALERIPENPSKKLSELLDQVLAL